VRAAFPCKVKGEQEPGTCDTVATVTVARHCTKCLQPGLLRRARKCWESNLRLCLHPLHCQMGSDD
jgi:hypothetical protein